MALKKYEEANIQAIAESIREKTGTDNTYDTSEMASGVGEVYEAGKTQGQYDVWDGILDSGKRNRVDYMFNRWECEYIRPPYKITAGENNGDTQIRILQMFAYNTKLKIVEKQYFDMSKYIPTTGGSSAANIYSICAGCTSLEVFEDIGLQGGGYYYTWQGCRNLHTIEVMRCVAEGGYNAPFAGCVSLVNIKIEGEIGTSFPIPNSPLSIESLKSIATHLKDFTGTDDEYKYTLTVKASAFEILEAEGATAEYTNIFGDIILCTWAEYIDFKMWKLTKV